MINKLKKINKEYIIIIILMLIYAILSFTNLGSFKAPKTYFNFNQDNEAIIELNNNYNISKIRYYTGNKIGTFKLMISNDGINYEYLKDINTNSVFAWEETIIDENAKYLKFTATDYNQVLGDIQIYNEFNEKITVLSGNRASKVLVDELSTVPDDISYMNSTYFDEIYFARSAYEYVHKIDTYEWTHPPIGKLIMSIPIYIFGFNPFTYRLMNNLAGLLMIPVMYLIAKRLFKNPLSAILAAILISFDNFHLAESRMGTVDSILVLFILLSILFMLCSFDKNNNLKKQAIYLLLSGLFIGLAIATKWTGLYAGLGLAIIFFVNLFTNYKDRLKKLFKININSILLWLNMIITVPLLLFYLLLLFNKNIANKILLLYFIIIVIVILVLIYKKLFKDEYLFKLSIICIISFIILPIIIYVLSYILFPHVENYDGTLLGIINQIKIMYNYHANLDATHPFTSKWYEWPIMYKPVWYYVGNNNEITKSTIVGIGNPAIWWGGTISIIYLIYNTIKKHDKNDLLIIILFLATYIPYIFVGRIMFMYHFYISLPFLMLTIVSIIDKISKKTNSNIPYLTYITLVVSLFIIFYPITSGITISNEYVESLKWLKSWIF